MNTVQFDQKIITPSKVVCVGRNYVDHIHELGNEVPTDMVIFSKPNSAISETLYFISEDTRFEGEICFLIEKAKISGIGFGLDLTRANIQNELKKKGLPWERAKSFNNSAVVSEFVKFDGDIKKVRLELYINDKLIQEGGYEQMIYKPEDVILEINSFMNLEDDDIIMSGTPKGVGTYSIGDKFTGKIYEGDKLLVEVDWEVK
jgi:2-keto-4-pentenoate hydratase/2-oxohepta-3-ene-1,7-dioic acid hydratase in catechol pathway